MNILTLTGFRARNIFGKAGHQEYTQIKILIPAGLNSALNGELP